VHAGLIAREIEKSVCIDEQMLGMQVPDRMQFPSGHRFAAASGCDAIPITTSSPSSTCDSDRTPHRRRRTSPSASTRWCGIGVRRTFSASRFASCGLVF
jgi:hypothetical protein